MPFDRREHVDEPAGTSTEPGVESESPTGSVVAADPVVVRRHAGVAALVGAAASAVAIAYLWRAVSTAAPLDWALFAVMALVGGYYLASFVDARTPLLVADGLGVRIRLGHEWRGLPWDAIGQVVVHPRRGLLRDGRLVFAPRSLARALEGLDAKGKRHVALNQKMYGAPLAVPLGSTTRIAGTAGRDLVARLEALVLDRAEVVQLDPRTLEVVDRDPETAAAAPAPEDAPATDRHGSPGTEEIARQRRAPSTEPAADDRVADHATDAALEAAPEAAAGAPTTVRDGGSTETVPDAVEVASEPDVEQAPARRRSILGGIGTIVSRVGKGRAHDVDGGRPVDPTTGHPAPAAARAGAPADAGEDAPAGADAPDADRPALSVPVALRETRPGLRAETTISLPVAGSTALDPADGQAGQAARAGLPEGRELRRPGSVDLVFEPVPADDRVRPISTLGDPVEPLVIDDFVTEPAYDPVIGPELTAARTRLGMSVDDLAERTRIRPHVIESIEVDDFAPCGGDFYARGHLRTLARILGKDPEPLLATFEERYATAPINPRRVFEAELATGMTGSMRSTVGGPNWGLLIGVVLSLVLVWGVVRLFTSDPVEMVEVPAPVLNGSAGVAGGYPADPEPQAAPVRPVTVRLTAAQGDTDVVVRDRDGMVVFSGELVLGERKTLQIAPPVRVRAADGGMVEVRVAGRDRGLLGEAGEPARRTYRR